MGSVTQPALPSRRQSKRNVLRYGIHDCSMGSSVAVCMSDLPSRAQTTLNQKYLLASISGQWTHIESPSSSRPESLLSVVPIPLAILFRSGLGLVDLVKSYRRSAVIHSRITKTQTCRYPGVRPRSRLCTKRESLILNQKRAPPAHPSPPLQFSSHRCFMV
jgi:hypothetical protein